MPHVGETNEPLLSRAQYGFDGLLWKPIQLDTNGYMQVSLPLAETIIARDYGWYNTVWRKNPVSLGYSSDKSQQIIVSNALAGLNTIDGDAVPAGEVWSVQVINAIDINNTPTSIIIEAVINGSEIVLVHDVTPTVLVWSIWSGMLTLSEGDNVRVFYNGVTLNDDIRMTYHAIVSDIDQ